MPLFDRMNQQEPQSFGARRNAYLSGQSMDPQGPDYSVNNAYRQSIPQQAEDYDEIMQGYRGMLGDDGGYGNLISRYNRSLDDPATKYQDATYNEAPEWAESYAKLRDLANTGGLSEAEQGSLRARAISPIRSVYANMQRNMDRTKTLGGGYSPNYNASAARMAREGSEQIGQTTTNANAAIAEMVQKGKLAMAPEMARLAEGKNTLTNNMSMQNATNRLRAQESKTGTLSGLTNAMGQRDDRKARALSGMNTLYGTTPALVNTFGGQVQNNQQMANQSAQAAAANRTARHSAAISGAYRNPRSFGA